MKPVATLCASLFVLTTLSACNPSNSKNSTETKDTEAPKLLTFFEEQQPLLSNESLELSFSEPVDIESFQLNDVVNGPVDITTVWNEEQTTVTVSPAVRWFGGDHSIALSVQDTSGNLLETEPFSVRVNLTFGTDAQAQSVFGEFEGADRDYYGNMFMDDSGVWAADYGSGALYFFEGIPSERDATPTDIITEIDFFNEETQEMDAYVIDGPQTPFIVKNQLFFVSYDDNAVLIFDDVPNSSKENIGIILGHSNFDMNDEGESCSASHMNSPEGLMVADGKLVVADSENNRVLIWNAIPTVSGTLPDLVLGQFDFENCRSGKSEFEMSSPTGIWTNGTRLLVTEGNNRVLGWHTFPTSNNQPADFVLGQSDFVSNECNQDLDSLNASTLCGNYEGIFSNGRQIFVADSDNNRVLVWNDWPAENGVAADQVIGQLDFETVADESEADNRFTYVTGVFAHDNQLIVSDEEAERLVVFNGR